MGYDARTEAFAALSTPMRLALIDFVHRRVFASSRADLGTRVHARATIAALTKRGLCTLTRSPTPDGVKVILDEFDGASPSLADCDELGCLRSVRR